MKEIHALNGNKVVWSDWANERKAMFGKTTVVNIKDHPDWKEKGYVYIGRGTPYGNPYRVRDFGRQGSVEMYHVDFHFKTDPYYADHNDYDDYDPEFVEAVHALKGKTLVCHCAPKSCHGDIIAAYLNRERSENGENK